MDRDDVAIIYVDVGLERDWFELWVGAERISAGRSIGVHDVHKLVETLGYPFHRQQQRERTPDSQLPNGRR